MYIFNVNGNSTLDTAILLCLLECQKKLERSNQLQLALRWNRADVARAKIFTAATSGSDHGVDDWHFFIDALTNDLTEFARLFVDYGLDLKAKLTVFELRKLYMRTVSIGVRSDMTADKQGSILLQMTAKTLPWYVMNLHRDKPRTHLDLSDINDLLNRHTRRFHHPVYAKDHGRTITTDDAKSTRFVNPFQELFLWAVLLGR